MDRAAVIEEMERARSSFRQLLTDAAPASLRRRSNGTTTARWRAALPANLHRGPTAPVCLQVREQNKRSSTI